MRVTGTDIQEVKRILEKIDPMRKSPRHIMVKMTKSKGRDRMLKAGKSKKELRYKVCIVDLLNETLCTEKYEEV